jgi:hypothetical protein
MSAALALMEPSGVIGSKVKGTSRGGVSSVL